MSETTYPYAFTYAEVERAYKDCLKNKRGTENAIRYEMNSMMNNIELCNNINDGTYEIGKSITFVVTFPVLREVFAADFKDRIVHHLVMNELMWCFENRFIDNSFSCRSNKGVLCGIKTMHEQIKEYTDNYTKDAWICKLDIKSFFMTIDKTILAKKVDELIVSMYPENRKKEKLRWLCNKIILHSPQTNCERRGDLDLWNKLPKEKSLFSIDLNKGLPIGNLTSQIFANFYMNDLDYYITKELGFTCYGRYVDDIMIVSDDKNKLLKSVPMIVKFAEDTLKIKIHPNKRYIQHYKNGVKFIGGVLKPNRKYVINRTRSSFINKLKYDFKDDIITYERLEKLVMTVNSYLGFLQHFDSFNIRKKILTDEELIGKWLQYINVDTVNYKKITIKNEYKKSKKIDFKSYKDVTNVIDDNK